MYLKEKIQQGKQFHVSEYFPVLSVHLSRVLDYIGLNELTVKRRRESFLQHEALYRVDMDLRGLDLSTYNFGSQTEGTTTLGLYSDLDLLTCNNNKTVIQSLSQWQRGKLNLLMIKDENTAPGYCRLQVLNMNIPMPENVLYEDYHAFDNSNRVLMKNTWIHLLKNEGDTKHGPALTMAADSRFLDMDSVFAYRCNTWPAQAKPWLVKNRPGQWPTRETLRLARETGCFLVPVGYRLSPTESLEWRISPSLTERSLMFSFNIVQIQCYVILKLIANFFLKRYIAEGSISSYILKTAMFYAIENTSSHVWKENRLIACVTYCLCILHTWVTHCYAPNYFIPQENLFAGRLTHNARKMLKDGLKVLITSNAHYFNYLTKDDISYLLKETMLAKHVELQCLSSPNNLSIFSLLKVSLHNQLQKCMNSEKIQAHPLSLIQAMHFNQACITFFLNTYNHADTITKLAVKSLLYQHCTWLGSLISSESINNNQIIPYEAIYWFYIGTYSDVATSRLKLASAFYCSGAAEMAAEVLKDLEKRYRVDVVQPVCGCYDTTRRGLKDEFKRQLSTRCTSNNYGNELIAHCVVFTRHEMPCTPHALRYEMFRSEDDDISLRKETDYWMDWAAVDSLPYLYYLQYLTYRQLQEVALKNRALDKLFSCIISEDPYLYHFETACNILGHCMELEQKPEAAIMCYMTSFKATPRNNASKWLLFIVRLKTFLRLHVLLARLREFLLGHCMQLEKYKLKLP